MRPLIFEGVVEYETEDGGCALIAQIDGESPTMFARVQSWDESAHKNPADAHADARKLAGKRVRVTVEVVDDKIVEIVDKKGPMTYDEIVALLKKGKLDATLSALKREVAVESEALFKLKQYNKRDGGRAARAAAEKFYAEEISAFVDEPVVVLAPDQLLQRRRTTIAWAIAEVLRTNKLAPAAATHPSDAEVIATAKRLHHDEGACEIDSEATVSRAEGNDDCGAYVQAWIWIPDSDVRRKE